MTLVLLMGVKQIMFAGQVFHKTGFIHPRAPLLPFNDFQHAPRGPGRTVPGDLAELEAAGMDGCGPDFQQLLRAEDI